MLVLGLSHRISCSAMLLDLLSTVMVVLAERNVQGAEIEADYMWGLIHPSYLVGDARYHLTTFSSAVNQLKNMRKLVDSKSPLYRGVIVSGLTFTI